MTVYVDKMQHHSRVWNGHYWIDGLWSHMIADTVQELDEMAQKLGIPLSAKQDPKEKRNVSMLHYDVLEKKRLEAIELGAVELDRSQFVAKVKEFRARRYHVFIKGGYFNTFDDLTTAQQETEAYIDDDQRGSMSDTEAEVFIIIPDTGKLKSVAYFMCFMRGTVHAYHIYEPFKAWRSTREGVLERLSELQHEHNQFFR